MTMSNWDKCNLFIYYLFFEKYIILTNILLRKMKFNVCMQLFFKY